MSTFQDKQQIPFNEKYAYLWDILDRIEGRRFKKEVVRMSMKTLVHEKVRELWASFRALPLGWQVVVYALAVIAFVCGERLWSGSWL